MSKQNNHWTQGFICAVVIMIQLNGLVDTRTRELFNAGVGNITLKGLKDAGVDEFDLSELKKHWNDLH